MRIDSQITLNIPLEQAQEVYAYLRRTYAEDDTKLRHAFPGLELRGDRAVDVSLFTDRYFDTPELALYGSGNTVRHRNRINTTNPEDRKSGRHLVQLKLTPPGRFDLRTELKFDVRSPTKYREEDDGHPLIGIVERVQRSEFKSALRRIGIEPATLRSSITIQQQRSRIYLYLAGENILSFSVDEFSSRIWWVKAESASVDIGLVENVFTAASPEKRQEMWAIREFMVADLKRNFPMLKVTSEEKYSIILSKIESRLPWLRFIMRHGLN